MQAYDAQLNSMRKIDRACIFVLFFILYSGIQSRIAGVQLYIVDAFESDVG